MIARQVYVTGHVQGVYFRAGCVEAARQHDVKGWVRNLSDGRVEAWLEGEADNVHQVVQWCQTGTERADVRDLSVLQATPAHWVGFEITD